MFVYIIGVMVPSDILTKRIIILKEKLKNKRVLVYGTGKFFAEAYNNHNLSDLNIIGVADKKYELNNSIIEDFGYKVIRISQIHEQNIDYILICLEKPNIIKKNLNNYFKKIKIISLNNCSYWSIFRDRIKQYFLQKKYRKNFVLIKQDGTIIKNPKIKNLIVDIGRDSRIEIYEPFTVMKKCHISCKENSLVKIYPFNVHGNTAIIAGRNNIVEIGEYTTIKDAKFFLVASINTRVILGKDCMLSYNIMIRPNDGHTIYDKNTRQVKNTPQDIIIGNHVWIGANATILKGAKVPSNTIIGACSLVNKVFLEENTIIVGIPAKIIEKEINWDRSVTHNFI